MPSKSEKKERAAIQRALAAKSKQEELEKLPLSLSLLGQLFNYLDDRLTFEGCDHSNKLAIEFIQSHELDSEIILLWLAEQGGYCDCEILANVEESWEDDISDAT